MEAIASKLEAITTSNKKLLVASASSSVVEMGVCAVMRALFVHVWILRGHMFCARFLDTDSRRLLRAAEESSSGSAGEGLQLIGLAEATSADRLG